MKNLLKGPAYAAAFILAIPIFLFTIALVIVVLPFVLIVGLFRAPIIVYRKRRGDIAPRFEAVKIPDVDYEKEAPKAWADFIKQHVPAAKVNKHFDGLVYSLTSPQSSQITIIIKYDEDSTDDEEGLVMYATMDQDWLAKMKAPALVEDAKFRGESVSAAASELWIAVALLRQGYKLTNGRFGRKRIWVHLPTYKIWYTAPLIRKWQTFSLYSDSLSWRKQPPEIG